MPSRCTNDRKKSSARKDVHVCHWSRHFLSCLEVERVLGGEMAYLPSGPEFRMGILTPLRSPTDKEVVCRYLGGPWLWSSPVW